MSASCESYIHPRKQPIANLRPRPSHMSSSTVEHRVKGVSPRPRGHMRLFPKGPLAMLWFGVLTEYRHSLALFVTAEILLATCGIVRGTRAQRLLERSKIVKRNTQVR